MSSRIDFNRVAKQIAPAMEHSPFKTNVSGAPIASVSVPAFRVGRFVDDMIMD